MVKYKVPQIHDEFPSGCDHNFSLSIMAPHIAETYTNLIRRYHLAVMPMLSLFQIDYRWFDILKVNLVLRYYISTNLNRLATNNSGFNFSKKINSTRNNISHNQSPKYYVLKLTLDHSDNPF
jgi:hypothetical protein